MRNWFVAALAVGVLVWAMGGCSRDSGNGDKSPDTGASQDIADGGGLDLVPGDGVGEDDGQPETSWPADIEAEIEDLEPGEVKPFPELPAPPAEPLEVIECASLEPPAEGTCTVEMGDNSLLLRGVILGLSEVYVGGQLRVDAEGLIRCVGCDCPPPAKTEKATVVTCPEGLVSPGLINGHDHITYTHNDPGDWGDERYEHRHDWRLGIRNHSKISYSSGASKPQVMWGEMRQALAGTTSLAGSGQADGFLRNLDKPGQEGLNKDPVYYNTFPLGDQGGVLLKEGCDYPNLDGFWVLEHACYLPHVGEGIDVETRNEFLCLSSEENGGVDLTENNSAFIHGIGMKAEDGAVLAKNGTAIIWSPRTNIALYGHTAPVTMYDWQGVLLGLGTDWTPSGSINMQRELACAAYLNDVHYGGHFTNHELWLMATTWNAMALGVSDAVGTLMAGKIADIAIYNGKRAPDFHRAIMESYPGDTVLVLRSGLPLFGDADVVPYLPFGGDGCEEMPQTVCGVSKVICAARETGYSLQELQAANETNYDLFFCDVPEGEPTCVPFRDEPKGGKFSGIPGPHDVDGDGLYDGDDNCPAVFNPVRPLDGSKQGDADGDGVGDMCDPCPMDADTFECSPPDPFDEDDDGLHSLYDNCPLKANEDQADEDEDGVGDVCDACPDIPNPGNGPCPATIYQLKQGDFPYYAGVTIRGVVTGIAEPRFFLQIPEALHDAELGYHHSGIYVYVPTGNPDGLYLPQRGDYVEISGQIQDWWGETQFTNVDSIELLDESYPIPVPVMVGTDEVGTGGALAEELEGTLVRIDDAEVTELNPPAGAGDGDPTNEYVVNGELKVNDFFYLTEPFPQVGEVTTIVGILRWANNDSKLEPRDADDIIPDLALASIAPALVYVNQGDSGVATIPPLMVKLNTGAPPEGAEITLTSMDPDRLTVPEFVFIPAGGKEAVVLVTAILGGNEPVVVKAAFLDVEVSAEVLVIGPDTIPAPVALTPPLPKVSVDGEVEVTVTIDLPGRPGGTVVALAVEPAGIISTPEAVTVAPDEFAASFVITGLAAGSAILTVSTDSGELSAPIDVLEVPLLGLVITEVFYDPPGGDDGLEWVELFNGTAEEIDLADYSLGNGGNDYTTSKVQLAGILAPGACFMVGGPQSSADNGLPQYDQAFNFEPDFQNSGPKSDGVALFDMPANDVTNASLPMDVVIYGGANDNGLIDETGEPGEVDVDDASSGHSLELTVEGWHVQPEPTPNDCKPAFIE